MENISLRDREILRGLAARVRAIADSEECRRRREWWRRHNSLQGDRPMILAFPEGAWVELLPDSVLQCEDPKLRRWEWSLRERIYTWEVIKDDQFLEPWFNIGWQVQIGNYGFDIPMHYGDQRGSYVWDPPIKDLERELPKLHFRSLSVDRPATYRDLALANEIFGDILPARIRSMLFWTVGLTWEAAKLVGLENLMFLMCDQPEQVHRLMAFLRDEHLHFLQWCEDEGLLTPNNEADYVGSGGVGCTDELKPDSDVGITLQQRWGFAESQETVGISSAMFEEFVLPYQVPLLEKFGLNCYGCCEGLEHRIRAVLRHVPRLRRISVAPSANQEVLAEALAGRYIYSRKPYPAHVCVHFNERAIREDLRHTLTVARGQPLEIILKDTHTVEGQPWRIARWVEIAREEVANAA
ncbi:MAG: hypothetical protein NZ483_02310 [Verrucomicrobiae bacterium]|nr:hypothetical protein [Verrucomicrobiae bacterium]MDW8343246.1 hypothetical protein [Verrucomicrobiae bacterium]